MATANENVASPLLLEDDVPVLVPAKQPLRLCHGPTEIKNPRLYAEIVEEIVAIWRISGPSTATGLLFYIRNLVTMIFLGHIGQVELAAGALAVGFANITGYSVLFGLAMGMDPICGQAYGAKKYTILSLAMHRTIAILLLVSVPVALLWLNVDKILLHLGQDAEITRLAGIYLLYSLPDLVVQSVLNPLRIYLRAQNVTQPIAVCSAVASVLHVPLNYYLVVICGMGIRGVAVASFSMNFNLLILLCCYIYFSGACQKTWQSVSRACFTEWGPILMLAIPSCVSVCLEWWWYELMIILCGLLKNPNSTVSAIGILMQMTALVYTFPSSLSYAVSTRIAQELGAGAPTRAKRAATVGTVFGAMVGIVALGFNIWARKWWGEIFTDAGTVIKLVSAALPLLGLCELGNCPQTVMCGVLRGSARANIGARVNLGGFYAVGMPVAVFLGFYMGFGFVGLWVGLLAAQAWCAAVLAVVVARTDWGVEAARAEELMRESEGDEVEHVKGDMVGP